MKLFRLLLLVVFLACPYLLLSQSTNAALTGLVDDQTKAVITGARVTAINTQTGVKTSTTTNSSGIYVIPGLIPGTYRIEVDKQGFKGIIEPGIVLHLQDVVQINFHMAVGSMSETLTVNGEGVDVNSTISSSFQHSQIINLPTNFRASANGNTPYYLLTILPGVESDFNGEISIEGGIVGATNFTVDGISTINTSSDSDELRNAFPSAESLDEMRVQRLGAPAEYGPPADITTTSKNGTNRFNGSLFWYYQDAGLDATPFGATSKPKKVANDFGASLGGPVMLPHLYNGHDKTFFFADFESFRLPQTGVIQNTVPTTAMRSGDLSYLCTAGFIDGVCNDPSDQIINPYNGQPFANDQIPSSMINSVAQGILKLYPLPNNGSIFTSNNYNVNVPANLDSNTFDLRIDQNLGSKLTVFGRVTEKYIDQLAPQELLVPSSTTFEHMRMLLGSATYTPTPSMSNEFRAGITNDTTGNSNSFNGKAFTDGLGLQGLSNLWWNGVTEVDFTGETTSLNVDRLDSTEQSRTIELNDDLTWVRGHHTFKFGADMSLIHTISPLGFTGADNYGTFTFNGLFSGNDFADFLLGIPGESDEDDVTQDNNGNARFWALYAQDSYRVSPRLTLDYGLRWEYRPGYTDAGGNIGNFDNHVARSGEVIYPDGFASVLSPPDLQSFDACPNAAIPATAQDPMTMNDAPCTPVLTASQAGLPQGLRKTSKRFMPRFGFAYTPFNDQKTVVRGSIGGYEVPSGGGVYFALTGTLQSFVRDYVNTMGPSGPAFVWPQIETGGSGYTAPPYGTAYFGTANQVNWKEPYSLQTGLSVERELGLATWLRVSYVNQKTTQLGWNPDWNQSLPSTTPYELQPLSRRPFPNWGRVHAREVGATSNYNALEVEVKHQYGSGLTLDSMFSYLRDHADNLGINTSHGICKAAGCGIAQDLYDRHLDYGNAYNPRQRWLTTVIYELPFGADRRILSSPNRIVNGLVGGWQINNIFEAQSGPFITPYFSGADPSGTGGGINGNPSLPDLVGPVVPSRRTASQWFLASGYACPGGDCQAGTSAAHPPIGRFGDATMGSVTAPGTIDWDLGLSKSIRLTGRTTLRMEGSFVNVLNHVNLGTPDMQITDPNNPAAGECGFGCITAAQGLYEFAGAREGQVGARVTF